MLQPSYSQGSMPCQCHQPRLYPCSGISHHVPLPTHPLAVRIRCSTSQLYRRLQVAPPISSTQTTLPVGHDGTMTVHTRVGRWWGRKRKINPEALGPITPAPMPHMTTSVRSTRVVVLHGRLPLLSSSPILLSNATPGLVLPHARGASESGHCRSIPTACNTGLCAGSKSGTSLAVTTGNLPSLS